MRNSPSRTRDAIKNNKGKKSIVVCIPAIDARVGLPFMGPSSMSAAATLRAVDILRREVRVAATTGGAEGMNDIEVVSLEVGALDIPPFAGRRLLDYDPKEYTKSWTPSEKLAYGPAWESLWRAQVASFSARPRRWSSSSATLYKLSATVECVPCRFVAYGFILGRFSIGCVVAATPLDLEVGFIALTPATYALLIPLSFCAVVMSSIVSHLPGALLDIIISFPYFLLSTHKACVGLAHQLLHLHSATAPELPPTPAPRPLPSPPEALAAVAKETVDSAPSSEHERETSENGSEADVESNDGAGVGESWVSLGPRSTTTSLETTIG
jgi:hypothetical protein